MNERKYLVADNGGVIARGMSLDNALLFMKAYCEKYYADEIDLQLQDEGEQNNEQVVDDCGI